MSNHTNLSETDIEVNIADCAAETDRPSRPLQLLTFFAVGLMFGLVLTKAEVTSWVRMQEMFQFQSFHLYGVIGSAIITAALGVQLLRRSGIKSRSGQPIIWKKINFHKGQIFGGSLFGVGWALTGACPGPIFATIGSGHSVFIVILVSALAGTWTYGWLRNRLPH